MKKKSSLNPGDGQKLYVKIELFLSPFKEQENRYAFLVFFNHRTIANLRQIRPPTDKEFLPDAFFFVGGANKSAV
jgi:hypothetical protein